ncbi:sensor histidine kinase [Streptomyces novaecaesareae]|uniref:sensor histidine kinase n=1 Tax=Streptomyces novaecaesareae TaxID=68244 RepID=UPI0006922DA4|nr:histidine kinase [Streptomyces novaecaesareae]
MHHGAQADLVAVSLRLGVIRWALAQHPDQAAELVDSTQLVAAQALESLRALVRGIHPPVLADRGLTEAVRSLAVHCAVPTRTDLDERAGPPPRAPADEALTNVARHGGAATALVRLRITADAIAIRARGLRQGRRRRRHRQRAPRPPMPGRRLRQHQVDIPCGS